MDELSIFEADVPDVWMDWTSKLFKFMEACYGNKFLDMWASADLVAVKRVWALTLMTLTRDELMRGRQGLMTRDWPPALPEFVKMCRPGIDPATAFYEAQEQGRAREEGRPNVWSHPSIYWAWRTIGAFEFRNQNYQTLRSRWEKALADEMGKGKWDAVPVTALQLTAKMKTTAISKRGAAELSKAVASVNKLGDQQVDHKAWMKKAATKIANGDASVPLYVMDSLQEMMGGKQARGR
ncbi:hypothetical protein ACO0K9_01010 [Undibacterium sp. Ji50W]|uniref:hypothetical protein n=1 Tax=Undibacterium sp. Ji50W TaxID=3413041 RepID=UPI003BF2116A